MKKFMLAATVLLSVVSAQAQKHEENLRTIFDEALTNGQSYPMLEYLSLNIGHRLSGSPSAAAAVEYTRQQMESMGFDKVFLQEVMVPHWVRGQKEIGRIVDAKTFGSKDMNIIALGNSVGTGSDGLLAEVIEVQSLDALETLGKKNIEGKIVFFNRPMDPKHVHTGHAYGGAGDQRVAGPSAAAKYGAAGVVVRSLTLAVDDVPHTGTLIYEEGIAQIPAVAISTIGANELSKALKSNKGLKFYMETHCEMLPDVRSYNVIGELTGSERPNEYIVVGGHLDSWDVGDGSHDDGAGCVQAMEAVRIFKATGIRPKRTLRAVMFMNEENGLRGGLEYARLAKEKGEKHIAALESDSGGFTPRGFGIKSSEKVLKKMQSWSSLLAPYDLRKIVKGYGGADINPMEDQGVVLIGLMPDSQRYFDYHHTASDTFDKVNKRELELGAASMAALIYLIDQEGI